MRTHYQNLKVSEKASSDEIRRAYKRLSQQFHPDKNQNSPESVRAFGLIQKAYDVLKDPSSRIKHNNWILQNARERRRIRKKPRYQLPLNAEQLQEQRQIAYRTMVYRKVLEAKQNKIEIQKQLAIKRNIIKQATIRCFYCLSLIAGSSVLAYDSDSHFRYLNESTDNRSRTFDATGIDSTKVIVTEKAGVHKADGEAENLSGIENNRQSPNQPNGHTDEWVQKNVF